VHTLVRWEDRAAAIVVATARPVNPASRSQLGVQMKPGRPDGGRPGESMCFRWTRGPGFV
jgi:hypothetical protein